MGTAKPLGSNAKRSREGSAAMVASEALSAGIFLKVALKPAWVRGLGPQNSVKM